MWHVIRELLRHGTTLLLTTQYLEEADRLADDIVVIDHGRAIARGTPDELKRQVGGERIELIVNSPDDVTAAHGALAPVATGEVIVGDDRRTLTAAVTDGAASLMAALRRLDAEGIDVHDVGLRRPTFDDVFLTLTGRAAQEALGEGGAAEETTAARDAEEVAR